MKPRTLLVIFLGIIVGLAIGWAMGRRQPIEPGASVASGTASTMQPNPSNSAAPEPTTPPPATPSELKKRLDTSAAAQQADPNLMAKVEHIRAITNNLRQLSAAAQTYMMDKGLTQAGYYDVVGTTTDDYIHNLTPVVGEDYTGINIHQDTTEVTIVAPDGTMATYDL